MNTPRLSALFAIALAFIGGAIAGIYFQTKRLNGQADSALLLILSEMQHQANVLRSLANNDIGRASEFVITRIQTDLQYLETTIDRKESQADRNRLCSAIAEVDGKIAGYVSAEPDKAKYVKASLDHIKQWCAREAQDR